MNPTKPIDVLLYEDNAAYSSSFKALAQAKRILVTSVTNVDSLLEALEAAPKKYQFVVLDARAFLHEGQSSGTESESNLIKIFREIPKIAEKIGRPLPYAINTGFANIASSHKEVVDCKVFEKGEEDKLIKHIWGTFENSLIGQLRRDYSAFEFAEEYFDDVNFGVLVKLLEGKQFEARDITRRVANLMAMRRLNEHVMDIVHDLHLNGAIAINNQGRRTLEIADVLRSNGVMLDHVYYSVLNIYRTASNFGSHTPQTQAEIDKYPSHETLTSCTHALLATMAWAKMVV
jgi:hypothetical protein